MFTIINGDNLTRIEWKFSAKDAKILKGCCLSVLIKIKPWFLDFEPL